MLKNHEIPVPCREFLGMWQISKKKNSKRISIYELKVTYWVRRIPVEHDSVVTLQINQPYQLLEHIEAACALPYLIVHDSANVVHEVNRILCNH